jgi:hypothetical protein
MHSSEKMSASFFQMKPHSNEKKEGIFGYA